MRMRNISESELESILYNHRYWSGDDMSDVDCSCGQWPKKWKPNGQPEIDWVTHVISSAALEYPYVECPPCIDAGVAHAVGMHESP